MSKLMDMYRNLSHSWGSGDFERDRTKLIHYEKDKNGQSVNFELEGLMESFHVPMQYIGDGLPVPHPDAMKAMFEMMQDNPIINQWKEGDGKQYPGIIKWLDQADEFRKTLVAEL